MAGFLSSLGITGATPPPASAYSDQQAETANLANAKSQLTGITSNIGLAMTTAKQLGLDPTYTQSLENLNSEATSIASANLTSAQLAAKTSALNDKLATAKATQEAAVKQRAITDMTAATTTIAARLAAVRADTRASSWIRRSTAAAPTARSGVCSRTCRSWPTCVRNCCRTRPLSCC